MASACMHVCWTACDSLAPPPPCLAPVCRVLVIGRAAFASVERSFPNSARLVLHNLKRKAEGVSLCVVLPSRGQHWDAAARCAAAQTPCHPAVLLALAAHPPACPSHPCCALQAVAAEFKGKLRADDLDALWAHFSRLQFGWASTELQDDVGSMSLPSLDHQDLGDVASERCLSCWRRWCWETGRAAWAPLSRPGRPSPPPCTACALQTGRRGSSR